MVLTFFPFKDLEIFCDDDELWQEADKCLPVNKPDTGLTLCWLSITLLEFHISINRWAVSPLETVRLDGSECNFLENLWECINTLAWPRALVLRLPMSLIDDVKWCYTLTSQRSDFTSDIAAPTQGCHKYTRALSEELSRFTIIPFNGSQQGHGRRFDIWVSSQVVLTEPLQNVTFSISIIMIHAKSRERKC